MYNDPNDSIDARLRDLASEIQNVEQEMYRHCEDDPNYDTSPLELYIHDLLDIATRLSDISIDKLIKKGGCA